MDVLRQLGFDLPLVRAVKERFGARLLPVQQRGPGRVGVGHRLRRRCLCHVREWEYLLGRWGLYQRELLRRLLLRDRLRRDLRGMRHRRQRGHVHSLCGGH